MAFVCLSVSLSVCQMYLWTKKSPDADHIQGQPSDDYRNLVNSILLEPLKGYETSYTTIPTVGP